MMPLLSDELRHALIAVADAITRCCYFSLRHDTLPLIASCRFIDITDCRRFRHY